MLRVTAALAACALALPGAALAQSAGDEQYADPFEEPAGRSPGPVAQPAPAAPPPVVAQRAAPGPSARAAAPAPAAELPRTGLELPLLIVGGAVLALGGFTIRRVVSLPH